MAERKMVTVGLEVASDDVQHIEFTSTYTLLDWDIIVFRPDISDMLSYEDTFEGKVCLGESRSFRLKERCEHWRREIKHAVDAGRTVICYLDDLTEIFVDTGQRNYSGTGRNRQTTNIVEPYNNYQAIPVQLKPRNATGSAMALSPKATALASYWKEFGGVSTFDVTLHGVQPTAPITTKSGNLPVGGVYSFASGGQFVALPMLEFYPDDFFNGKEFNETAKLFARKVVHSWFGIDKAVRSEAQVTPTPSWAVEDSYSLAAEVVLKASLLKAEADLSAAQKKKENAVDALAEAGSLRSLLFEKGPPLEKVIIKALTLLGFEAEPYKENGSEFDVVFRSSEGRLLGEAEGKDAKAINIDKLRQLAMNVLEDLDREEVNVPAKAILFGNGYRLLTPSERPLQFTDKCISSAVQSGTGLVATSDLFLAAKHMSDTNDAAYAERCRIQLLEGAGIITLPATPIVEDALIAVIDSAPSE